ncbi:hypothetical protein BaRGS_00024187 [Batillaria attramentaria]|uniref:Beta-1,3-galactosyl-O-glycosyl-glycoprotein beta-1,6-N-acetylglucosaminyltransferase n=1 Tax=Batillaria attramentaria TaxID=370345 RepID=A0ABD0KBT0_9CAEN
MRLPVRRTTQLRILAVLVCTVVLTWQTGPFSRVRSDEGDQTVHKEAMKLYELLSKKERAKRLNVLFHARDNATRPRVTTVSCPRLWAGNVDAEYLRKAASVKTSVTRQSRDLVQETLNCTSYILNNGFRSASVSEEELSFPLAFSLMVYRDVQQVERLLRAVYRPHNLYCVHVDRKSGLGFQSSLRLIVGCLPNVFINERSLDVRWGNYSVLEPELECMRRLWSLGARWRYFINLTGQEFPLKTNKELVAILKSFRGANDIRGTQLRKFQSRWNKNLPAPFNLTVTKGSKLIIASRGFVDYVVNSRVSRVLQEWVRKTEIPDETFFSTLNHNPRLGVPGSLKGNHIVDTDVNEGEFSRYLLWIRTKQGSLCKGKFVRGVCVFGVGDLPYLTQVPYLFANKFHYGFQPLAYDCLEEWYFLKIHHENIGRPIEPPLNMTVYVNSYLAKDVYTGPVKLW